MFWACLSLIGLCATYGVREAWCALTFTAFLYAASYDL